MTFLIWFLGLAAEQWLTRFSWLGLAAAILGGLGITLLVRRKTESLTRQAEAEAEARAAAEARARIEPDRMAGRREGGD
jgi:hypothetical protein